MSNQKFEKSNRAFEKRKPQMLTPDQVSRHSMDMLRECVGFGGGKSIKAQIREVSRLLGWDYGRTRRLWYGNAKVTVDEWLVLQWRLDAVRERAEARRGLVNDIRSKVDSTFPDRAQRDVGPLVSGNSPGSRPDR